MTGLKRILLAEDDIKDVELVLAAFKEINLENMIDVVKDGEEALDYVFKQKKYKTRENENPVFIMLDLKMPKINGLEVLKQVKESKEYHNIPIVIFTSSKMESDLAASYDLGVNAYVVKPVEFEDFVNTVRKIGVFWTKFNETL